MPGHIHRQKGRTNFSLFFLFFYYLVALVIVRYGVGIFLCYAYAVDWDYFHLPFLFTQSGFFNRFVERLQIRLVLYPTTFSVGKQSNLKMFLS
jgi:hypothetical protein